MLRRSVQKQELHEFVLQLRKRILKKILQVTAGPVVLEFPYNQKP